MFSKIINNAITLSNRSIFCGLKANAVHFADMPNSGAKGGYFGLSDNVNAERMEYSFYLTYKGENIIFGNCTPLILRT